MSEWTDKTLKVGCPKCGAKSGKGCQFPSGKDRDPHGDRWALWRKTFPEDLLQNNTNTVQSQLSAHEKRIAELEAALRDARRERDGPP